MGTQGPLIARGFGRVSCRSHLVRVLGRAGTVSSPKGCGSGSPQTFSLYNASLSFSLTGVKLFGGWVVGGKGAFAVSIEERVPCHSRASLFLPQQGKESFTFGWEPLMRKAVALRDGAMR